MVQGIGGGGAIAGTTYKLAPQYTIYKTGSTYYAETADGVVTSSANASTLIQSVIDTDPTGLVFFKDATYDVSSASLKLQADTPYYFKGSGPRTILDAGAVADAKVFEVIAPTVHATYPYWGKFVQIDDMTLCALNGYGLHCDFADIAAHNGDQTPWWILNNVNFGEHPTNGCKYGMKINTLEYSRFRNLRIFNNSAVANGIGIWLTNTSAGYNCGNSSFYGTLIQSDHDDYTSIYIMKAG